MMYLFPLLFLQLLAIVTTATPQWEHIPPSNFECDVTVVSGTSVYWENRLQLQFNQPSSRTRRLLALDRPLNRQHPDNYPVSVDADGSNLNFKPDIPTHWARVVVSVSEEKLSEDYWSKEEASDGETETSEKERNTFNINDGLLAFVFDYDTKELLVQPYTWPPWYEIQHTNLLGLRKSYARLNRQSPSMLLFEWVGDVPHQFLFVFDKAAPIYLESSHNRVDPKTGNLYYRHDGVKGFGRFFYDKGHLVSISDWDEKKVVVRAKSSNEETVPDISEEEFVNLPTI